MYEELYEAIPGTEEYLKRIGYSGSAAHTQDTLSALVFAHQKAVPFENFDICELGKPAVIEIMKLYEKVVLDRRGGYCFELNAIFAALLQAMGFEVWPILARICRAAMGEQPTPPMHRINLVCLDGKKYFTDVGFGGAMPAGALVLEEDARQEIRGTAYHFERRAYERWTLFRETSEKTIEPMLNFSGYPSDPVDFLTPNFYCSTNPSSNFVTGRTANIRFDDGFASIRNTTFHLVRGESEISEEITSKEHEAELLRQYFGIVL